MQTGAKTKLTCLKSHMHRLKHLQQLHLQDDTQGDNCEMPVNLKKKKEKNPPPKKASEKLRQVALPVLLLEEERKRGKKQSKEKKKKNQKTNSKLLFLLYHNTFTTYLWATKPRSRHSAPVPGLPHTGRSPPPSFAATRLPPLKCAAKRSAITIS